MSVVHTTIERLPDVLIFHDFGSQLQNNSSDVTMLWQKPSVRVSPRLRGSSLLLEWEIIELDHILIILCRHRYCKEKREKKKEGNERNNVFAMLCSQYCKEKKGNERNKVLAILCSQYCKKKKGGKKVTSTLELWFVFVLLEKGKEILATPLFGI